MANICCDDVYFYSNSNSDGLNLLWDDLEHCINLSSNVDSAWIGNLLEYKGISTEQYSTRGSIIDMDRDDTSIFIALSTAWTPLFEVYQAIADAYQIDFVLRGVESGCNTYINTDVEGIYFPEKYIIKIPNENSLSANGKLIATIVQDEDVFVSSDEILKTMEKLGYYATSFKHLKTILEEANIFIHKFNNSY